MDVANVRVPVLLLMGAFCSPSQDWNRNLLTLIHEIIMMSSVGLLVQLVDIIHMSVTSIARRVTFRF